MTYLELLEIYNKKITYTSNEFPADSIAIANSLNLRVKNSIACRKDTGTGKYPLQNCNAMYAIVNGEYTIYYDENYPYKNFAIAHEIAHHILQHTSDDINKHHNAQLLGAIIVAPKEAIKKHHIKSALELANTCKLPISVAEDYWTEISIKPNSKKVYIAISVCTCVAFILIALLIGRFSYQHSNNQTLVTSESTSQYTDNSNLSDTVYVTRYGNSYHKAECIHIKGHNTISITIDEAIRQSYKPCKTCFADYVN